MGFWHGRRVVVTGGRGFVGSQVMARLQELGADAISCSRRDGCDLRDIKQALAFFEQYEPQLVINCAANQGGLEYQRLCPATIFYDNLLMGANTMEAACLAGAGKYVNVIAGCTYPGGDCEVQREDDLEAGPLHPSVENYGGPKRAALIQARCLRRQYGFNAVSLLIVNMFGPGEHFHPDRSHAIAALLRRFYEAKRDRASEVVVWGTGKAIRDWLYIQDAVDGIVLAAEHYDQPEAINFGTGQGVAMSELAELIREVVGCPARLMYDPDKPDGAPRKVVDISRARTLLGWQPKTPLAVGLRRTLEWFVQNYETAVAARA